MFINGSLERKKDILTLDIGSKVSTGGLRYKHSFALLPAVDFANLVPHSALVLALIEEDLPQAKNSRACFCTSTVDLIPRCKHGIRNLPKAEAEVCRRIPLVEGAMTSVLWHVFQALMILWMALNTIDRSIVY